MESKIIICGCGHPEHQIIVQKNEEDNLLYLHIHLNKLPILKRLKYGIKYIFGYQCRYGAFYEIVLDKSHYKQLSEIADFLDVP